MTPWRPTSKRRRRTIRANHNARVKHLTAFMESISTMGPVFNDPASPWSFVNNPDPKPWNIKDCMKESPQ